MLDVLPNEILHLIIDYVEPDTESFWALEQANERVASVLNDKMFWVRTMKRRFKFYLSPSDQDIQLRKHSSIRELYTRYLTLERFFASIEGDASYFIARRFCPIIDTEVGDKIEKDLLTRLEVFTYSTVLVLDNEEYLYVKNLCSEGPKKESKSPLHALKQCDVTLYEDGETVQIGVEIVEGQCPKLELNLPHLLDPKLFMDDLQLKVKEEFFHRCVRTCSLTIHRGSPFWKIESVKEAYIKMKGSSIPKPWETSVRQFTHDMATTISLCCKLRDFYRNDKDAKEIYESCKNDDIPNDSRMRLSDVVGLDSIPNFIDYVFEW